MCGREDGRVRRWKDVWEGRRVGRWKDVWEGGWERWERGQISSPSLSPSVCTLCSLPLPLRLLTITSFPSLPSQLRECAAVW